MRRPDLSRPTLVAACLVLAGCAASPSGPGPTRSAPVSPAPATSVAGSVGVEHAVVAGRAPTPQEHAQQEAARLLALAPVVPGSTPLPESPEPLAGPGQLPGVESLVTDTAFRSTALRPAEADAWLRAHPPAQTELRAYGTSGSARGRVLETTFEVLHPPADLASEWVEHGVGADAAGRTVVRTDVIVVWLDPTPYPDAVTGPRVRVTVAGGCPESLAGAVGVTNTASDLGTGLLPVGSPTGGLVCEYAGGNPALDAVVPRTRLTAAEADALARRVAALRTSHPVGGVRSCPMSDGTTAVVALSYPGRDDVDLWWPIGGCPYLANGHIRVDATGTGIAPTLPAP